MKTEIRVKRRVKRLMWFIITTIIFVIASPVHVLIYYLQDDDRTMKSAIRVTWKSYLWMMSSDNDRLREEFYRADRERS